jgi:alkylhydroperoxidase family enzyme
VIDRDAPLSRAQRRLIAAVVADATGDLAGIRELGAPAPADALDQALVAYADTIARAPWRLGADALAPLRDHGLDDATLFDVIQVASHQSFASRLAVALAALAR